MRKKSFYSVHGFSPAPMTRRQQQAAARKGWVTRRRRRRKAHPMRTMLMRRWTNKRKRRNPEKPPPILSKTEWTVFIIGGLLAVSWLIGKSSEKLAQKVIVGPRL
jgi:hypothetical protein